MYNLDVGEHYYSPMTSYLESERGTRGETPGAMTYDERLQRQWLYGRRYEPLEFRERYARASSAARGETSSSYLASEMASRNTRAASEMRASSAYSRQAAVSETISGNFRSFFLIFEEQEFEEFLTLYSTRQKFK